VREKKARRIERVKEKNERGWKGYDRERERI